MVAGVEKGIAWLSNLNVRLLCVLLLFVLVTGPTLHLLDGLVQNTGDYLGALLSKSFDIYFNQPQGRDWLGAWTLFYWAWWIAWAPFVGLFVARISRGRTIREVIFGVLLIPLGFTLAWLSIFGNTVIDLVLNHGQTVLGEVAKADAAMTLYKLLEYLPWSPYVAGAAVVVACLRASGRQATPMDLMLVLRSDRSHSDPSRRPRPPRSRSRSRRPA